MQITATFESIREMKDFVEAMGERLAMPQETSSTRTAGQAPKPIPVQTAPVTAPQPVPVQQAPVQTAPVQAVPVQTVPVQTAPVQTTPVQSAPVQMTPVQSAPVQSAPVMGAVPTSTPSYTQDDLVKASMTLMDSGKQGELISLLGQFGVNALPELPPEKYGAFATALRGMGAQI